MASTYSTNLRIELMADGENSNTWGGKTNTNLTLLEQAVSGVASVAMTDADYTLTTSNAATDEARNMVVTMTGTLTQARNVIVPSVDKVYVLKNSTTGGFAVTVKTSGGTGISVANGETETLYCDATNVLRAITTPTGTGAPVRANSPTLVTPNLDTPASGILTNCTGLPTAGLVDEAVTYAKMQNVSATDKLLGRSTAGAGDVEEITCTAFARSILDDADEAAFKATVNLEAGVDFIANVAPGNSGNVLTSNGSDWTSAAPATPATGVPTGTVFDYAGSTEPTGYLFLSGKTMGDASSGGTARANADTSDLYTLLWNSMADAQAAVSSGRGASAAADFAAHKTITLPDARGRVIAGKDNMGGTTASRLTSGGAGIVGTTLGIAGGSETHTLTTAQLANHSHGLTNVQGSLSPAAGGSLEGTFPSANASAASPSSAAAGSGNAHNNTQPTLVFNKIIKL